MSTSCPTCVEVSPRHRRELIISAFLPPLFITPLFLLLKALEGGELGVVVQVLVALLLVLVAALAVLGVGILGGLITAAFRYRKGHNPACLLRTVRLGAFFPFFILKEMLT